MAINIGAYVLAIRFRTASRTTSTKWSIAVAGWCKAGKLAATLDGSNTARREVDEAVLLRKAGSWHYEREWRLIGALGLTSSPLEMEEIIFGMRCKGSTKYAVMKALDGT